MKLYDITHEEKPREKLPTLRQWLKLTGDKKRPLLFPVFLIWIPGKFKNFTLETECFRFAIEEGSEAFNTLSESIEELSASNITFSLRIVSDKPLQVSFAPCKEKGAWEALGESGYKFKNK